MKQNAAMVSEQLQDLFERLMGQPKLKRGSEWKGDWDGWQADKWRADCCGVYVLWQNEDDLEQGNPPVYVGEGITGTRIWDSFRSRADWQFAQILYHDTLTGDQGLNWRLLLERFAIVVLRPKENKR
jgi:hypothetical protein